MTSQPSRPQQFEITHVLFVDFVEYSRLPLDDQTGLMATFQQLLRGTAEFRRAEASRELITIPTGDGMALVFFRDPVAPVNCSIELARALAGHPEMKLRMGVHSGPVTVVEDINGNRNAQGPGMNFAERVMDCGDAGHILLSSTVAELLGQLGDWASFLHDLGECQVKHGDRLHLFNLYTAEIGNSALPTKLRGQLAVRPSSREETPRSTGAGARVALLYKRFAQPDEQLLQVLERELAAAGHSLFIDRHLAIGVEWAKEIERQIRTADAVVPLLSTASTQSEMLAYEIEIAYQSAQAQGGKPRLLPVRVNYTGPLPAESPLPSILDPLEYSLWQGPADDDRVVGELLNALRTPAPAPVVEVKNLEPAGGAVPLDSEFYVVRARDAEFHAAIARRDSIVLVKGARQMGKTSLLARGLQRAREAGAHVVLTDFQKLNAAHLESAEMLFLALADAIADKFDLEVLPEEAWNARRGPSVNFERYLRREVLGKIDTPIVWGMDEVDRLFDCSFGSEVFGLFRSWHNERALDPSGPWSRLTLAIAYATEAHLFIRDPHQSPFNVGTRMELEDFTFEQVADLNRRHGAPLRDEAEIGRFHRLVGGHPYLVRRGLLEMAARGLDIAAFEQHADRDEGIFGDHLRRILVLLVRDPALELDEVVRGVLRRRPCPTQESFYRLRSAGVMTGTSQHDVRPRCRLYESYLASHLL
jgi:class 3 adenylate cyclase